MDTDQFYKPLHDMVQASDPEKVKAWANTWKAGMEKHRFALRAFRRLPGFAEFWAVINEYAD